MDNSQISVSVIIPVLNNRQQTKACLDKIFSQRLLPSDFEIIVIDNGSTDGTWEMLQQIDGIKTHQISEPKSPYVCRNKGIELASKDWLLFLDSKIKIRGSDWLSLFLDIDSDPIKIYYARILPDSLHLSVSQWIEMVSIMEYNILAKKGKNGQAGCFLAHRNAFSDIGKFKPERSGGDSEWSKLAIVKGYTIEAVWNSPVYYSPKNHPDFLRKTIRYGIGDRVYFLSKDGSGFNFYIKRILEMRPPKPIRIYRILKTEGLHQKNPLWYCKIIFTTWYYRIYQKLVTLNWIHGQSD